MALRLDYAFPYQEEPIIPLRLSNAAASVETETLLDTGADVSLFDAALAEFLNVHFYASNAFRVVGISGIADRVRYAWLEVAIRGLPDDLAVSQLAIGFVPGLSKTVGNLLGRNFLQHFDFGLHHHVFPARRRLYLGRP